MKTFFLIAIILIGLLIPKPEFAQSLTQVIRGTIADNQSKLTLPGATVVIIGSDPVKGAAADMDGRFSIQGVAPGRYDLKVTCIGYEEIVIPSVIVTSGKEVVLEITLKENITSLKEVVISGVKKNETLNRMTSVSARSFSMEEVNRYSGGHSDPSRLVANFAGVSSQNDATNDIVIRGNSPAGVLWRIEGLNVANPNHFATLGTTGGPISVLNPNILANSDFMTSAFPADYGNANAGVFDIRFRNGNTEKREHMIQFGMLTGLEAMSEGPFAKGSDASYLIGCRYSFTGLAQAIGIPIGTAATPRYQDLSFKLNSGQTEAGRFTLFGMGGISKIDFKHGKIDSTDIFARPNQDSYSRSKIGVLGLTHFIRLNKKAYLNTTLGVTYAQNSFDMDSLTNATEPVRVRDLKNTEIRYMVNTYVDYKWNARLSLKGGIQLEFRDLDLRLKDRQFTTEWNNMWDYQGNTALLSAFLQTKYRITEKLELNAGWRYQYLTLNGSMSQQPRLGMRYQFNRQHTVSIGYGYNSQMQSLSLYFFRELKPDQMYDESNRDLGFTNSHHFVVAYDVLPFPDWRIKLEGYALLLTNVPVSQTPDSYSRLNEGGGFSSDDRSGLVNKGTGTNLGVEFTLEKFFSKGYYGLLTGSLYQSTYKGSDGVTHSTAFNGNFVYNILVGKEFKVGKTKRHAFTVDLKFTHAGGLPYTPVDLAASREAGQQVLMGDGYAFSERYPDFMRLDLKAGFTYNSKTVKLSQSIYVDIQNVTNNKNIFAMGYNPVTKQINSVYQIGFYPNVVYKIQF